MHLSIEHNETVEIKEKTARSTLKKPNVKRRKKSANICEICCKTFSGMGSLKIHIASIHEGKKPFKCNICDFTFSRKGSLNGHILRVHEKKKTQKQSISTVVDKNQQLAEKTFDIKQEDKKVEDMKEVKRFTKVKKSVEAKEVKKEIEAKTNKNVAESKDLPFSWIQKILENKITLKTSY